MQVTDITTQWHVVEAIDTYSTLGKNAVTRQFLAGQKGYAKRNDFTPSYFQILMRTPEGSIQGWYVKEVEAVQLLVAIKIAPANARPDEHWKDFWNSKLV